MAELILSKVCKSFGRVEVIHDVDLHLRDREFVVFVGPSGCGKSTLLRLIAGLEDITSGELLIDGERVNDLKPKQRGVAMVFQSYALYPHMTAYQNMAFGLELSRHTRQQIDARVRSAAETLALTPLLMSSRPAIRRSSVDLPQPDGPTKTTNSRSRRCRSTS